MAHGSSARRRLRFVLVVFAAAAPAAVASAAVGGRVEAHLAYLDPGSGSFILQALVAAVAGVIVAINAYWTRIRNVLGRSRPAKDESDATGAGSED
jgi:hypothetical protein